MTSREIAEVVQSRHDNVKRTIETLVGKGVISTPHPEEYTNTINRPVVEYRLDKRSSIIVVAQLCPQFTAALVDRWAELEAKAAAPKLPATYIEALRELANAEEKRLAAETAVQQLQTAVVQKDEQLQLAEPKVAFYDAVGETSRCFLVGVVAKTIGIGQNKFFEMLREQRILMRRSGGHVPYQAHASHFKVRYQPYVDTDGYPETRPTSYVTAAGVQYLVKRFGKEAA